MFLRLYESTNGNTQGQQRLPDNGPNTAAEMHKKKTTTKKNPKIEQEQKNPQKLELN